MLSSEKKSMQWHILTKRDVYLKVMMLPSNGKFSNSCQAIWVRNMELNFTWYLFTQWNIPCYCTYYVNVINPETNVFSLSYIQPMKNDWKLKQQSFWLIKLKVSPEIQYFHVDIRTRTSIYSNNQMPAA